MDRMKMYNESLNGKHCAQFDLFFVNLIGRFLGLEVRKVGIFSVLSASPPD
jgi:hypothetical protein